MKIARYPEFSHAVKARFPVDGGHEEVSFKARFKLLPADEMVRHDLSTHAGTDAYLDTILVGWEGWLDDEDQPVPVNDANKRLLINTMPVRNALLVTYGAAMLGAKKGN